MDDYAQDVQSNFAVECCMSFKAAPVTADSAFTKTDRSPVHTRAEMSDTMPFFRTNRQVFVFASSPHLN